jgi:putative DNA primase/helicase
MNAAEAIRSTLRGVNGEAALPSPDFGELRPLPSLLPSAPEPAPVEAFLPTALAEWVVDSAERLDVPVSLLAPGVLVGLSSIIGRAYRIAPKAEDDWRVPAILWGGVIARSGFGKSPALETALEPIKALEAEARDQYVQGRPMAQARVDTLTARVAGLKDALRSAQGERKRGASAAPPRPLAEIESDLAAAYSALEVEESGSKLRRIRTSDSTVEKLGELVMENPRGILCYRDELAGFIGNLDRSDRPGDRAFFLESWGGGSFNVDRIGRGSVLIPGLAVTVLGGLQPDRLRPLVEGSACAGGDGLLARFQVLTYPDDQGGRRYVDRKPDAAARARAFEAYRRIDQFAREAMADGTGRTLHYSRDAQDRFKLVYEELQAELTSPEARASSAYEAHLAKFPRLVAALSLVLQLADEPTAAVVGLDALDRAIRWCALLGAHARKVYGALIRPDVAAALNLGAKLRAQAIEDGIPVRTVYRAGWAGLREPETVEAGLRVLAEHGWLTVQEAGQGAGRRRRIIRTNPAAVEGGEA